MTNWSFVAIRAFGIQYIPNTEQSAP